MTGRLLSLNVGEVRTFEHRSRSVQSGIWKAPVPDRRRIAGVNIAGDTQADREAHGGEHKAVYSYAIEDYRWWETQLGRSLDPGQFGENLTVEGIDVNGSSIGDRWTIGSAQLEVSEPRVPCFKLGVRMEDPEFVTRFGAAGRPGTYLRIVTEGEVAAGDQIDVEPASANTITVAEIARIYYSDRASADRLAGVEGLSPPWQAWARRAMARQATSGT